jgi:two-component system, sensor histidine kinase
MTFDEAARLEALQDYRVLDTPAEELFDNITRLAARIFQVPIALVTLVDEKRQWFKSRFGVPITETVRENSFCAHSIGGEAPLLIEDARADPRFANNPLVVGSPGIRFYCGVPLRSPDGHGLGSLCVIDHHPRTVTPAEVGTLQLLARQVELDLEIRRQLWLLKDAVESQREKRHATDIQTAMLVHDLRSPLTSLTLLASFVKPADDESRQALEELLTEARRMRRMLQDVLDVYLHEVGQLRARRRDIELVPFAQALAQRLARLGGQRGQKILLELPESPVSINADPDLLERVLENLVINAIDHGPPDQPITLALSVTDNGRARGEVRDRGTPIAPEDRANVFKVFQRLGLRDRPSGGGGHGLGLAFCSLAIEAHGGRIWLSAPAGGGNCFQFEFPQPPARAASDAASEGA